MDHGPMILGWHHITVGCSDAQATVDFYGGVLKLGWVKRTVNFDDPFTYHLYFGDELGRPGTLITFFEWRGMPAGHPGIGGTHHLAFRAASEAAVVRWRVWLTHRNIQVDGPYRREGRTAIELRDPDGLILEIAAPAEPGPIPPPEGPVTAVDDSMMLSRGLDHLTGGCSDLERTHAFYGELLGLGEGRPSDPGRPGPRGLVWNVGDGGGWLSFLEHDPREHPRARIGVGQTHHFAMAVQDGPVQQEWRDRLRAAGVSATPVLDRVYFRSIYFRDPDGHIVELATMGPGFSVDEPPDALGSTLRLPPWLEAERRVIEGRLTPLVAPDVGMDSSSAMGA
jgi:glyoxalase family protein